MVGGTILALTPGTVDLGYAEMNPYLECLQQRQRTADAGDLLVADCLPQGMVPG